MAERIPVPPVDAIDARSRAVEAVTFALDGVTYDINLNRDHARKLRGMLATYIRAGRTANTVASRSQYTLRKQRIQHINRSYADKIGQVAGAASHQDVATEIHSQPRENAQTTTEPTIAAVIAEIESGIEAENAYEAAGASRLDRYWRLVCTLAGYGSE